MKLMKETSTARSKQVANGASQTIQQTTSTFSLFSPEFNLTTNKVKHNGIKAKFLANQFADRRHKDTCKTFIRFVIPVCMDRTNKDNCYSIENFKDVLYKLHTQFRGTTLIIDIVPTGELEAWNILRNRRLKQRKQSLEVISQNTSDTKTFQDARIEGRRIADEWEAALEETRAHLNSCGHIVTVKHWPDAFPSNMQAKQIQAELEQLYQKGEEFSALIDDAIRTICTRISNQGQYFLTEAATPCILNYLLEELAFQVYIMMPRDGEEQYDFHLYEYDDLAPKLTQTTLAQIQGVRNSSNSNQPSLLEFKYSKIPANQSKNSFTSNIGGNTQPQPNEFYTAAGKVLKKEAKGEKLTQEDVVIKNAFWELYRERQEAAMDTTSDDSNSATPSSSPE